jgi:hypothetical protein
VVVGFVVAEPRRPEPEAAADGTDELVVEAEVLDAAADVEVEGGAFWQSRGDPPDAAGDGDLGLAAGEAELGQPLQVGARPRWWSGRRRDGWRWSRAAAVRWSWRSPPIHSGSRRSTAIRGRPRSRILASSPWSAA